MSHRRNNLFKKPSAGGGGWYDTGNALNFSNGASKCTTTATTGTTTWTVSFWINLNSNADIYGAVLAKQNVTNRYMRVKPNQITVKQGAGSFNHVLPNLIAGSWYHIFYVMDAGSARCWINGVESTTGTDSSGTQLSDSFNMFGANHTADYLNAVLDDLYYSKDIAGTEQNAIDIYNNGAGANPQTVLSSNGRYFFKLNESGSDTLAANDGVAAAPATLSGFNNRMDLVNFPASGMWVAGKLGNALDFDGVDDYVSFPQHPTGNDTWAISCWINGDDIATINYPLVGDDDTNNYIRVNATNNRIIVRASDGTQVFFTGFTFLNSTWYHIVVTSDNLSCRCYVNGVESTAGALTINTTAGGINQFLRIGYDNGPTYANGRFDEFGLWYGYALTSGDVVTLYNNGNGAACSDVSPDDLWVYTKFNGAGTDQIILNEAQPAWIPH